MSIPQIFVCCATDSEGSPCASLTDRVSFFRMGGQVLACPEWLLLEDSIDFVVSSSFVDFWLPGSVVDWLVVWLIGLLAGCMVDWLDVWLIGWLAGGVFDRLVGWWCG